MTIKDKNFYNESSAKNLGWEPYWFENYTAASNKLYQFDDELVKAIIRFQAQYGHGLVPDGLCGPSTYKAIFTQRTASQEMALEHLKMMQQKFPENTERFITCQQEKIPINWQKYVDLDDSNNLNIDYLAKHFDKKREVKLFVIHYDATVNSKTCCEILKRRNLSVQWMLDNDGTIYQGTDMNSSAQHAGTTNKFSVGVEISNAVSVKYQSYYKSVLKKERPVMGPFDVNGVHFSQMLGFYDEQINALKELIKVVTKYYDIPLRVPTNDDGSLITHVFDDALKGNWKGVVCHYHLDHEKYDTINLDIVKLIEEIKKES